MSHSDRKYGISYEVNLSRADGMAGASTPIYPGDDEQLRATLQSLLENIKVFT